MKILVICQYYYPEPFRITDICEELVNRKNDVTVITGVPNYPMGEIYPGYDNNSHNHEVIGGVNVYRCNIHPRKTGIFHRLLNYYSYSYKSKKFIDKLNSDFDVVFINQLSPVMMANAGIRYAKKHNKKSVLYCLDLWPASLSAGGIKSGFIYKWFFKESKKVYKSVDKILVSSKSFKKYFKEQFNIDIAGYLPQYAEDTFNFDECRKTPNEFIDLMFAGNIGTAQSIDTIIKAAALCKNTHNLRWHIVGDGKELNNCKALANSLSAPVIFHGRKPMNEMPKYYSMADALIVTMQKDPIISLTLPGKVQAYMSAGKPIIGAIDGETAHVINEANCGLCVHSEDAKALADIAKQLTTCDRRILDEYASNSFKYYKQNFDKHKTLTRLEEFLNESITN